MSPPRRFHALRHRAAAPLAAVALALASVACAEEDNPFARPGGTPPPQQAQPPSPLDSLEFRGVMAFEGTTFVTIVDTTTSRSTVVTLGQTANGVTVSDYQASDDSVLLQSGANSRRVKMKATKIVALATPPPQPVPPPGGPAVAGQPVPPPGPPGVGQNDEEVRLRMQRVAEEIRRRREMRREIMERAQQQQQAQP